MTRVKRGVTTRRRHNRRLKATKGFRGLRSKIYTQAQIGWMKQGLNAYLGRKHKKRDFRALFTARISAGLKAIDPKFMYSRFIAKLKAQNIMLDRKVMADMALNHSEAFKTFVTMVMSK